MRFSAILLILHILFYQVVLPQKMILKNTYRAGDRILSDEIILTEEVYRSRNRQIVERNGHFYIRKNTLIEVRPDHYFRDGYIARDGREYIDTFYFLARTSSDVITVKSGREERKLHFIVDDQPPRFSFQGAPALSIQTSNVLVLPPQGVLSLAVHDLHSGVSGTELWYEGKWHKYKEALTGLREGEIRLALRDAVGNTVSNVYTLQIDHRPPEMTYKVDTLGPAVCREVSENTYEFSRGILGIEIYAVDTSLPAAVYYSIDLNGKWEKYAGPVAILDTSSLFFYTVDAVLNRSSMTRIDFRKTDRGEGVRVK